MGPCALRRGVRGDREHPYVPSGRCRVQLRAMRDLPAGLGLADRARVAGRTVGGSACCSSAMSACWRASA
jgi:hypothetical protein